MRSSRRFTVGSSPHTSSPTSAAAIAARIPAPGTVRVSLRRSTMFGGTDRSPGFHGPRSVHHRDDRTRRSAPAALTAHARALAAGALGAVPGLLVEARQAPGG